MIYSGSNIHNEKIGRYVEQVEIMFSFSFSAVLINYTPYSTFYFFIFTGVMGAKNTSSILPFCHPLPLDFIDIKIEIDKEKVRTLKIDCIVKTTHKTGVEMEAIIGVTHAAVCVYDMLKAVSHNIVISQVKLISKSGGKSAYVDNDVLK